MPAVPMASDFNLRCRQFQCKMAGSFCTTKCGFPGRGTVQCPDLAKFATENPDQMRTLVANVAAAAETAPSACQPLSAKFQEAFPTFLPGAPVPAAPAVPPEESAPALADASIAVAEAAHAENTATLPPEEAAARSATPVVAPPVATAAAPSKPPAVRRQPKPKTKEQPMPEANNPAPGAAAPGTGTNAGNGTPADPVNPPKRKGGIQKGQKLGPRRKVVEFVRDGTATFIETEKGSGLFRGVPGLMSAEDALLVQNGARVIWALRIRPF